MNKTNTSSFNLPNNARESARNLILPARETLYSIFMINKNLFWKTKLKNYKIYSIHILLFGE